MMQLPSTSSSSLHNIILPNSLYSNMSEQSENVAAVHQTKQARQETRINELLQAAQSKAVISVECFPPKTDEGVQTLFKNLSTLMKMDPAPLFVDFTWGAGGSTSDLTLELCTRAKDELHATANMHLTCTNMESSKIDCALKGCRERGITNVLALRGDPPVGQERWVAQEGGFQCAYDLVKYIRQTHGDYFCITVAGYPEGHPDKMKAVEDISKLTPSERLRCREIVTENGDIQLTVCSDEDFEGELQYLKTKVDAGADCIITQMFFDAELYGAFVRACREHGVNVPVIPGIMLINSYAGFKRMTNFCKSRVPAELATALERIKDSNEQDIQKFAVDFGVKFCRRLLELGAPCLHFYTLNSAALTVAIVEQLHLTSSSSQSN